MRFEWDPEKARRNIAKHGISFDDAVLVWHDPFYGLYEDQYVGRELRWHALGLAGPALLLVVHSYPDGEDGERVRIISARKATKHERRDYEEGAQR
jgi:uncharacterized DUF497 family protein